MNEYDIKDAVRRYGPDTPNLRRAALTLNMLMEWTNAHSDGWPYWRKPKQAATKLMALIEAADRDYRRYHEAVDCTGGELKAALTPIKAFLTRQGTEHAEVISG